MALSPLSSRRILTILATKGETIVVGLIEQAWGESTTEHSGLSFSLDPTRPQAWSPNLDRAKHVPSLVDP
ncbi:hypothetical protein V6N13_047073 [Hibiscus sabdariffa]|uniref:Uncharacterized protein n=1 Tax=Hibiscus sabdariffa TaxID=183260 RepID=A0ABR2CAQ4_9ROSI